MAGPSLLTRVSTPTCMKYLLTKTVLGALALFIFVAPFGAHAETETPTCVLIVTSEGKTSFVQGTKDLPVSPGSKVQIAWGSSGATQATNSFSGGLSGFREDSPTQTKTYTFTFSNGASQTTCSVTAVIAGKASIDSDSLSTASSKPTLRGTTSEYERVVVEIRSVGSTKVLFKSKSVRVRNDSWSTKVSKSLKEGTYDVTVLGKTGTRTTSIATGRLTVGDKVVSQSSQASFRVGAIALLSGGEAKRGTTVPVSYLQITNVGKEQGTLRGFWLKQYGGADMRSVIGLVVVDDRGGSRGYAGGVEGSTPFKNNVAFAPTNAVFAPGERKLFTIKAVLSSDVSSYVGSDIKLSVTSVDSNGTASGAYPILGTTWYITN